jgi:hypothetical protein
MRTAVIAFAITLLQLVERSIDLEAVTVRRHEQRGEHQRIENVL